mmetsp:Transcript_25258/g.37404  ORF Transcript_25258/g.37404 Transcript_25258/m.37404 type:complete len:107 (+) Transcript_25258:1-321(+)
MERKKEAWAEYVWRVCVCDFDCVEEVVEYTHFMFLAITARMVVVGWDCGDDGMVEGVELMTRGWRAFCNPNLLLALYLFPFLFSLSLSLSLSSPTLTCITDEYARA